MPKIHLAAAAVLSASIACSGHAQVGDVISRDALQWREMVPGVSFAPAHGDWEQGAHGKYVQVQSGTEVPMHTHGNGYRAVMISGRMSNSYGDGRQAELSAGDFFEMAARRAHAHQCLSEDACVFYTYSDGLWDIEVVSQ